MRILTASLLSFLLLMVACNGSSEETNETSEPQGSETDTVAMMEPMYNMTKDGISVTSWTKSITFPEASIEMTAPAADTELNPGKVKFNYSIENYKLGQQTEGAGTNGLANSGDGQHIHAIINNRPYMAKYKPEFETELEAGRYVILSFLSRSYHESLKNPAASTISQFMVGSSDEPAYDLSAPHMFYSRPKGTYTGADAQKVLLDFYLVNCDLSADGYQVRATINGTEFIFDTWQAYVMEGLPMGENTIKLELLDQDGALVESPFNPVERTVTLQAEAM